MDGSIPPLGCSIGFLGTAILVTLGTWRLKEDEIPRVALATAAFFVASSMHVPIPIAMSSVHLVLNGLVGVMLGRSAPVAIFIGILLQAFLLPLPHGGRTTIGVNTLTLAIPALIGGVLFRFALRRGIPSSGKLSALGGLLGGGCVLSSILLQAAAIWFADEPVRLFAPVWIAANSVLVVAEALFVAGAVSFLARVKPELLGIR